VDATGRNGQSIAAAARFTEPVRFGRLLLAGPHPVALGEGYAAFRHADPAFAAFLKTRMDLSVAALQRDVLGRFGTTQIIHGVRAPGWLIVNGADASSEALGLSAYLQATGDPSARTALRELAARIDELREPTGNGPFSRFHLMPTCGTQILRVDGRSVVAHLFRGPRPRRQGTNRAGLDGRGESLGLGRARPGGRSSRTGAVRSPSRPWVRRRRWRTKPRGIRAATRKKNSARTPPRDCPDLKFAAEARRPST